MISGDAKFAEDHFSLFGLPVAFAINADELDRRYRELLGRVHPDKHVNLSDADQRVAMQWATRANEAYQVLKNPLQRAHYLLLLKAHDPGVESNTSMPTDFLVAQLELREQASQAESDRDMEALESLDGELRSEMKAQYLALADALDRRADYPLASGIVRQLMFQEKLLQEIDRAIESIEA
ncbi:MAG TPA: Fe-S protein assembly co-chaperone HscB [Rhodocyclaceae bacterium]